MQGEVCLKSGSLGEIASCGSCLQRGLSAGQDVENGSLVLSSRTGMRLAKGLPSLEGIALRFPSISHTQGLGARCLLVSGASRSGFDLRSWCYRPMPLLSLDALGT